jgi:SAM-dependent methyltransferase
MFEKPNHYDAQYFNWQKSLGLFGGWANAPKFKNSIGIDQTILDFGCGGGFLLNNIHCGKKIGIEPNNAALESIKSFDILHFPTADKALAVLGEKSVDVVISVHVLEHCHNPYLELSSLKRLLKNNGIIHFIVPCDSPGKKYIENNIDKHLYSWSPSNIANLFDALDFTIIESKLDISVWPPFFYKLQFLGWPIFNFLCKIWGRIDRRQYQVEIIAKNKLSME